MVFWRVAVLSLEYFQGRRERRGEVRMLGFNLKRFDRRWQDEVLYIDRCAFH